MAIEIEVTDDDTIPDEVGREGFYLNAAEKVSDAAVVQSSKEKALDMVAFGPMASMFGAVDTIVQSLSFDTITEKDDIMGQLMEKLEASEEYLPPMNTDTFADTVNVPLAGYRDYYKAALQYHLENKEGTTLAGEIGTAFAPIGWATKAIQTPKVLTHLFSKMGKTGEFAKMMLVSSGKTAKQRIESLKRIDDAFVMTKSGTTRGTQLGTQFSSAASKEVRGLAGDLFKEGMAANVAMYTLYNDSDLMFPEENSALTTAAFWLAPDVLISAIGGKYMRGQINRHIASEVAPKVAKQLNPLGLAVTDVLSRPGERSVSLATDATAMALVKQDAPSVMSPELRAAYVNNADARKTALQSSMTDTLVKTGNDAVYKHGIDEAAHWDTKKAQPFIATVMKHAEQEPSAVVGITSINGFTAKSQTSIPKAVDHRLSAVSDEISVAKEALKKLSPTKAPKEYKAMQATVDALQAEKTKLDEHTAFVLEPEGLGIVPLESRQHSLLDDMTEQTNAVMFKKDQDVTTLSKQTASDMEGLTVGMTDGGSLLLSKDTKGAYQMQLLQPARVAEEQAEKAKLTLIDMTYTFNLTNGRLGKSISSSMDSTLRSALSDWKGSSSAGPLRAWANAGDTRITDLQNVFKDAGFHKRLYEIADEDGFITLYRGQGKAETADASTANLVSMTPHAQIAKKFAGSAGRKDITKTKVHVEDVIAPVDTGLHEFEFIVANAHKRKTGANMANRHESLKHMNYQQRMATWGVAQRALDTYDVAKADPILAYSGKTHVELDYAAAVLKANPDANVQMTTRSHSGEVNVLRGEDALRAIEYESLSQKFKLWQDFWVNKQADAGDLIKLPKAQQIDEAAYLKSLNLPAHAGIGDSELIRLFKKVAPRGGDHAINFKSMFKNLDEVDHAIRQDIKPNYLAEPNLTPRALEYTGGTIRHGRDYSQKPVVAHYANRLAGRIGPDEVNNLITAKKAEVMSVMSTAALPQNKAYLVDSMFKSVTADLGQLNLARSVDNVVDGTLHQGKLTTHAMKTRSEETARAIDRLFDPAYKKLQSEVQKIWKPHTDTFNRLLSSKGEGSLNAFNIAVANLRAGWDILPEKATLEAGKHALRLDPKSAKNAALYERVTGQSFKSAIEANGDDVFMPMWHSGKQAKNGEPIPVVLDDLAVDGLSRVTALSHTYLDNLNFIRKAKGLDPINKREWHIPYKDLSKENLVYIVDESGSVIRSAKGKTFDDALQAAKDEIKTAAKDGKRYSWKTEGTLRAYVENAGDTFENVKNFSAAGTQTAGIGQKGATEVVEIGSDVFKGLVDQLQKHFDDIGRYSATTIMESELNFIKKAKQALPIDDKLKAAGDTVYDHMERSITQTASLTPKSEMGKFYQSTEDLIDGGLQRMWDGYRGVKEVTGLSARSVGKQQEALTNIYGDAYKPYENTLDMIERTTERAIPPTFRGIGSGFNKLAGDLVLRVLDFGMPVLNFASVAAVSPAVMKGLQKGINETPRQWKQRIGAYSSTVSDDFALPSATKMSMTGIHELFSPRGRAAVEKARDMGLMKQDVYERIEMITAPIDGYAKRMIKQGINKASIATDWSEEASRAISFSMMHGIAKDMLKLNDDAAINFAHLHANAVVGDYRAMNKPELFQGAVGMPMGLFTTWIWNMGQRVFTDAAQGRLGAVGMQALTQQFLFGTESLPGASLYIDHLTRNYSGDRNIVDTLDDAWGEDFVDALMKGTIGSATGVAVGTRANIGLPALFSGGDTSEIVPALGVGKTVVQGLWEAGKTTYEQGPDLARYREILSVYGVNGLLKHGMNLSQGYKTDRAGDMANDEITRLKPMLAGMFELKTVKEERLRQDLAKDKLHQLTKNAHFDRLGKRFKTLLRNVDSYSDDELGEEVKEVLGNYARAGGSPQRLRQYIMGLTVRAQTNKAARLLVQKLKRNDDESGTMRLLNSYTKED